MFEMFMSSAHIINIYIFSDYVGFIKKIMKQVQQAKYGYEIVNI